MAKEQIQPQASVQGSSVSSVTAIKTKSSNKTQETYAGRGFQKSND